MKHDNPPAFPPVNVEAVPYATSKQQCTGFPGTLRDWFAGHALQGYLAGRCWEDHRSGYENVWTEAYRLADSMLAQRQKEEK